jgi:hypothetical protein
MQTFYHKGYFPSKFKSDISKFLKSLKNLISKFYDLSTIDKSLGQVFFAKTIDNLLGKLVGSTSN